MSQIGSILNSLSGTCDSEILSQIEEAYENIENLQNEWYKKADFNCADSCGECCRNFEPDLLEAEAIYMAAWLLENQPETAERVAQGIFPLPREKGCQFWQEEGQYHCTIYGGRPAICRLFGACSSHSKSGEQVWKPCKFYPADQLEQHNPPLTHKQYSAEETVQKIGAIPPLMSNLMEGIISISPDNTETSLIRDILPKFIQKLLWLIAIKQNSTK